MLAGATTSLFALAIYLVSSEGEQPPPSGEVAKQRFVAARAKAGKISVFERKSTATSATAKSEIASVPDHEREDLEIQIINPLQESAIGDVEWENTTFALNDLFWLRERRLQCAQDYALPLTAYCKAEYAMIVSPSKIAGTGTIIDGEVTASPFGQATEADVIACANYAKCILEARVGETIPLPDDQSHIFVIEQPTLYVWAGASLFDIGKVRELIHSYEEDTLAYASEVGSPLNLDLFHRLERNQLEYLRAHLAMLSENDE